eukprot:562567-Alexandrium_andersonii.AAC.1
MSLFQLRLSTASKEASTLLHLATLRPRKLELRHRRTTSALSPGRFWGSASLAIARARGSWRARMSNCARSLSSGSDRPAG